jgi:hypothetical protein
MSGTIASTDWSQVTEEETRFGIILKRMMDRQYTAIHSAKASAELARCWVELEQELKSFTPNEHEQRLISALCRQHQSLSTFVIDSNQFLDDICSAGKADIAQFAVHGTSKPAQRRSTQMANLWNEFT